MLVENPTSKSGFHFQDVHMLRRPSLIMKVHSYLMLVASYSPATYSNYTTATSLFWQTYRPIARYQAKSRDKLVNHSCQLM